MPKQALSRRNNYTAANATTIIQMPEVNVADIELKFDYSTLPTHLQAGAMHAAREIHRKARRMNQDFIDIGNYLIEQKALLRGTFVDWVKTEFAYSYTTAQTNMNLARNIDRVDKPEMFALTVLYELTRPSTPQPVIETVHQLIDQNQAVTVKEVKQLIQQEKEAQPSPDAAQPEDSVHPEALTSKGGACPRPLTTRPEAKPSSDAPKLIAITLATDHVQRLIQLCQQSQEQTDLEIHTILAGAIHD